MPKISKIKRSVQFLFEIGSLRKIARSHRQTLLTNDLTDNISSHSYRVTMIGYLLATLEKADTNKVIKMCLLHDISEARSGDQNWVNKKYLKVFEDEITNDQLTSVPGSDELNQISKEYSERKTIESKLAKDADLIDQILLLREHEWVGNKEASIWLKGREQEKRIFSKSAKKFAQEIYTQKPDSWWSNLWTADRR